MHGSANTTILGPARRMDVLEFTKVDDNTTTEVRDTRHTVMTTYLRQGPHKHMFVSC